ncbi:MAG: hypothetical protein EA362_04430 [Saprospirales bacterium]|nr:MAG: hypothetical protein EA362_04430 [Saprospirales bacterium]
MNKLFFLLVIVISLSSCASSTYFQLHDLESEDLEFTDEGLIFRNEHLMIGYNFWTNGGSGAFVIKNNTDSIIYIDLANSYSVRNGLATPYYLNRTFTESSTQTVSSYNFFTDIHQSSISSGSSFLSLFSDDYQVQGFVNNRGSRSSQTSVGRSGESLTASKTSGIEIRERRIISIPPNAAKIVKGSPFLSRPFVDCAIERNPNRNQVSSISFEKQNSPLRITNVISYSFQESDIDNKETLEMSYWISQISNMSFNTFTERSAVRDCERKVRGVSYRARYGAPYRFFIRYFGP